MVLSGVLRYPNFDESFEVYRDASGLATERLLMHSEQPIAFESKKLTKSPLMWPFHEKKLFVIMHCFKIWCYYLDGVETKIFINNVFIKYLDFKVQASQKELR